MMYSVYKLGWQYTALRYSFSTLEPIYCSMSGYNCCYLTCIQISQEAGEVVWYPHLLKNFPQFVVIHIVKGFGIVNKEEVEFPGTLLPFQWFNQCWQFDLWFFCLFYIQVEHLEVHGSRLLKHGLESFEYYFASMWDACNCVVVWTFFVITFLWDWNENRSFPVLWSLMSFHICIFLFPFVSYFLLYFLLYFYLNIYISSVIH